MNWRLTYKQPLPGEVMGSLSTPGQLTEPISQTLKIKSTDKYMCGGGGGPNRTTPHHWISWACKLPPQCHVLEHMVCVM
eukprot:c3352_g1_i1 orf=350-586(+)